MNKAHPHAATAASLFLTASLFAACSEAPPTKEADSKSVQEIAKEAMTSKGKLSKEQINALIKANAACRPGDQH
ncbi:hypothetical protein [Thiothrix nivea]|uniref:Lipoprotein n=1 Tax=Thiothrix nivea (strain ATCC 35100 / DSM 5205 / JP2) TaxID=870187 RepID=A0A656HH09_THINJ|nr:hypothetical protein [Thiothrix nivea]EIJ35314.1 hypothetical protein Thini_2777 [Thiothrix nivea DSM 5205]